MCRHLRDDRNGLPQRLELEIADVASLEHHRAAFGVVEPHHELKDCGLAGAAEAREPIEMSMPNQGTSVTSMTLTSAWMRLLQTLQETFPDPFSSPCSGPTVLGEDKGGGGGGVRAGSVP